MKKIFLAFAISAIITTATWGADNFTLGKNAFIKKDFSRANYYFVQHLTSNPNDPIGRYYYAQTLTFLKNYEQAILEYGYVVQLAPGSLVANYAKASLYVLEKNANTSEKSSKTTPAKKTEEDNKPDFEPIKAADFSTLDHYLNKTVSASGEINTWDITKMPIKVYINKENRPKSIYIEAVKEAFKKWESISQGLFSFEFTEDANNYNAIVQFEPKRPEGWIGKTTTTKKEGHVVRGEIEIRTLTKEYKAITKIDAYNVALHEVGHLLGIDGHSDSKEDIMYPTCKTSQNTQTKTNNQIQQTLSLRDINTLKAMYSIDKNPYSTSSNSLNKVLGSKQERMRNKLQDELDYAAKFPDSPISYNNVAWSYEQQQQDADAIIYYKKALEIDELNEYANTGLARIYSKQNDLKNAQIYYRNIIKQDPHNIPAYYNLTNLYIRNQKTQQAKSTLASLIYRNPEAKNDPVVKQLQSQLDNK